MLKKGSITLVGLVGIMISTSAISDQMDDCLDREKAKSKQIHSFQHDDTCVTVEFKHQKY